MSTRILLTGASGFIGSAVAAEAVARGHKVAALVRGEGGMRHVGVEDIQGDLQKTPWEAIRRFQPEVCVHCAWISTPGVYLESKENHEFLRWSKDFLRNAFDAGVKFAVVLGTCIEYAITGERLREDSPLAPASLYARTKNELREWLEGEKLPVGWARIFYPYGVGEHRQRLCTSLIEKLGRNEEVVLKTPQSTKDYIHITDVASALVTVVEQRAQSAINIGTGEGATVLEIAREIGRFMDRASLIKEAAPPAPDPYGYVVADARRLYSLGWQPKVRLSQGLMKLVEVVAR